MLRYRLLKDLPTFKAGDMFYISQYSALMYDDGGFGVMVYSQSTLKKFPDILTDWFEEIQEEPTDSIHWKPKNGDEYFYISDYGNTYSDIWRGKFIDNERLALGFIYPTEKECIKAKKRKLAEVRLRRTSTFKPDFENDNGGWVVFYDPQYKAFATQELYRLGYGNFIRYKTRAEAGKSIRENREDWLTYFGIEEED